MGYITNSFQNPNFYSDELDFYLEPIETKVLLKAIREIIGWHHLETRSAFIAYSVFIEGKIDHETGERYTKGCGICRASLLKALQNLETFNILVRVRREGRFVESEFGRLYQLNFDTDSIEWELLRERKASKEATGRNRLRNARAKNPRVK